VGGGRDQLQGWWRGEGGKGLRLNLQSLIPTHLCIEFISEGLLITVELL
jgi:hypothetical protein